MVAHVPIPEFLLPFIVIDPAWNEPCEDPHCRAYPREEVVAVLRAISEWAEATRENYMARVDAEIEEQEILEERLDKSIRETNILEEKLRDREDAFVTLWQAIPGGPNPNPEQAEIIDRVLSELGL